MSKYRHEYKYLLDAREDAYLRIRAAGLMQRDAHVQDGGEYQIRSLYFDDLYNTCANENENGTDPRSKFRVRYYNHDLSHIRLEKKSKTRGMTLKESCRLTLGECQLLMQGQIPTITDEMTPAKKQLLLEMQLRGLQPKVIVLYDREPFVYPVGNVRITFDRRLASCPEVERFLDADFPKRPVLPAGQSILEVKWDELIPLHIKEAFQTDHLQWTAFSKYFMCRKYIL